MREEWQVWQAQKLGRSVTPSTISIVCGAHPPLCIFKKHSRDIPSACIMNAYKDLRMHDVCCFT